MTSWGEYYHAIASQMALYRQSNRRLCELAELRPGMAVLDLASGSGLTAEAALEQVPEGLRLYLVDQDPSMMEVARARLGDRAAGLFVAGADQVEALLPEKVDRVLCNLSFWYFPDPEAVLQALRRVLKPTGRLCFNLSGTTFNTGGGVVSPQWAFLRLLHQRGLIARSLPDPERLPNQRSIEGTLLGAGFKPFGFEVQTITPAVPDAEPGGELYNLLRLSPAPLGKGFEESVQLSLSLLPEIAPAVAALHPQWRVVHFLAQPAIAPEEALLARFGSRPPGGGAP